VDRLPRLSIALGNVEKPPPLHMTVHCDLKNPRVSALIHEPGETLKGYCILTIELTDVDFVCEEDGRHGRRGKIIDHFEVKDAGDLKAQVLQRLRRFSRRVGILPEHIAYTVIDEAGERAVTELVLPPYWLDPAILRIQQDNAARRQKVDKDVRSLNLCAEADKLIDEKRLHKARRLLRTARELSPDFFWPPLGLAETDMFERRIVEAERHLEEAGKLLPGCPFPEDKKKKFAARIADDMAEIAKARARSVEFLREAVQRPALPAPSNLPAPSPSIDIVLSFDPPGAPEGWGVKAPRSYLNPQRLEIQNPEEKLLRKFQFVRARPIYRSQCLEETAHALFSFSGSYAIDGGISRDISREAAINLSTGIENEALLDCLKDFILDEKPAYDVRSSSSLPDLNASYDRAMALVRDHLNDTWREPLVQKHDGDHRLDGRLRLCEFRLLYQPWISVDFEVQFHGTSVLRAFFWDPVVRQFADAFCERCGLSIRRFFLKGQTLCCETCNAL
jgi:hypothetical protein